MNDQFYVDYFVLSLIKELKNKTMEMQIIVMDETRTDFDMKTDIANFRKKKLILLSKEK